mmetsp:Transcript_3631/g.8606  ORF Transcript_3631/g.8606 Transcript_3631/m.8606 type:complete len:97 (+) Transcript_3631:1618-1908(+)
MDGGHSTDYRHHYGNLDALHPAVEILGTRTIHPEGEDTGKNQYETGIEVETVEIGVQIEAVEIASMDAEETRGLHVEGEDRSQSNDRMAPWAETDY